MRNPNDKVIDLEEYRSRYQVESEIELAVGCDIRVVPIHKHFSPIRSKSDDEKVLFVNFKPEANYAPLSF